MKYNDLSIAEFVNGYCHQLLEGRINQDTVNTMIMHLRDLMEDASDYCWEKARNFHGVLLGHYERKRLDWTSAAGGGGYKD